MDVCCEDSSFLNSKGYFAVKVRPSHLQISIRLRKSNKLLRSLFCALQ